MLVIAVVEDTKALAQIDEIAATPGIDVIFIGTSDLSFSLGLRGKQNHPKLDAAIVFSDILVVPVLVCGARIPAAEQLPAEMAELASRNAFTTQRKLANRCAPPRSTTPRSPTRSAGGSR